MILRAISRLYAIPRQFPADPIRATVIGAGQFSTTLSGETLWIDPQRLPLTNLPVIHPFRTPAEMTDAVTIAAVLNHHRRLGDISTDTPVAVSLPPLRSADWTRIEHLAADLADAARSAPLPTPWVFTMADNYANLLGRTLTRLAPDTACIVLDEIETETADYLDIGRPVEKERPVVPVIAKSLLFE